MRGPGVFGATDPIWVPDEQTIARSRLLRAMRRWGFDSLEDLHRASVDDPEWFWRAAVEDFGIEFATPFERVLDDADGKPFPRWFVGGSLNLATLCSSRHAASDLAEKTAVVYEGDAGQRRALSYAELDREVRRFAANLRDLGVAQGDRVVIYAPVVPETVVSFLAIAMIGAIAVPAFTGYGSEGVAARLRDSGAKVMITADGTTRRGARVELKKTADRALREAPATETVIVIAHLGGDVDLTPGRDVLWHELPDAPAPVEVVDYDPDTPVIIAYTSGTTGKPKGILHSHAGLLVKSGVDFAYVMDIHSDDVLAWTADMGWMLGPLMITGGLQLGATIVMTEGVPTHPSPTRVWEIVERNGVTIQGIAPTAARAVMAATAGTPVGQDLSTLRAFASTGEAWDEPTWRWLFEEVGRSRLPIINYSGGTEVPGALVVGYPFLPADAASFNGPAPGIDVGVVNAQGEPVFGEIGELAVFNTWPGMTHAFWQDRDRYLKTYWDIHPGTWIHGDLASVEEDGSWRIQGRSDDTIKVSGRRIGPAELEAALLKDERLVEVAVIGVPDLRRGQRVVAFAVPKHEDADADGIVATAEANIGRGFAPTIHLVKALPKTANGKIMRRAARARYLGEELGDLTALDSREALEAIPVGTDRGDE